MPELSCTALQFLSPFAKLSAKAGDTKEPGFPRKGVSGKTIALEHGVLSPGLSTHPPVLPRSAVPAGIAKWVAATRE
jgi:hypothetical protein